MTEVRSQELYKMCQDHFNEPMLSDGLGIVRCVGYGETGVDCYVLARRMRPDHEKLIWLTCVGGYYFLDRLKGQRHVKSTTGEDCDDLHRLDKLLELNGAPKEIGFILKLNHDDMETK